MTPPFLTASLSMASAQVVPGPPQVPTPDDLEDAGNGVADGRRGSQRQVDNALLDTQAMGGLAAHELAGAGDLKGGLLNLLGDLHHRCGIGQHLQGCGHNAGARDAYVDDGVGLATAVDGARHKRGVLDHVGKADKLGSADGVLVGRELSGVDDGLRSHEYGSRDVDAGTETGDVDAGADAARGGERLRDGLDDAAVGVADALLDECGEAAQVIDAERLGRAVEGMRDGGKVLSLQHAAICATGVTETRLLTMGIPYSRSRFSAGSTRCSAVCVTWS